MLNKNLISTPIQRALAFFCLNPDLKFHAREAARQIGISAASMHRAAKILEKEGVLSSERKGKMVFYQLDESRPLVRQYKTMAAVFALEPLILEFRNVTDLVILYGSCVSGDFLTDSDVDLLIVTSNEAKVEDALSHFREGFTKEINPVITSLAEWMDYEKRNPVFYKQVTKGLVLYKSPYYESEI